MRKMHGGLSGIRSLKQSRAHEGIGQRCVKAEL